MAHKEYQLFINGEWKKSSSGDTERVVNPSTEEVVGLIQNCTTDEAIEALKAAEIAQKSWRKLPARSRAD